MTDDGGDEINDFRETDLLSSYNNNHYHDNNDTLLGLVDDQEYYTTSNIIGHVNKQVNSVGGNSNHNDPETFDEVYADKQSNIESEYDLIWILLTLSLCSICLHIVILLHVRSTAPSQDAIRQKFEEGQALGGDATVTATTPRNRKMLAYWVYDRYKRENDVESFDGQDESVFTSKIMKRNAVQQLSSIPSKDSRNKKFALDPDLSVSDDDDLSEDFSSSDDYNEFIDAEEGLAQNGNESERLLVHNGTGDTSVPDYVNDISFDDHLHFFPTEDDLKALDSPPQSTRRRRKRPEIEQSSSWRNSRGSLRGLVDIKVCLSKQGYDGKFFI